MKKRTGILILSYLLLALAGCATLPSGPSVRVLPGQGKSFEQFQVDDSVCKQWAAQSIGITAEGTINKNIAGSATVGTLVGAAAGALIGAAAGDPASGAAIGAGSGLLLGTASGAETGQVYGREAQRMYDNTYVQCMFSKGHLVPGKVRYYRIRSTATPPPPDYKSVPPDYVPEKTPPSPPSR